MKHQQRNHFIGLGTPAPHLSRRRGAWWRNFVHPIPWLVLAVFSSLAFYTSDAIYKKHYDQNEARFDSIVDELSVSMLDHMTSYRNLLDGFSALVKVDGGVNRKNWKTYYDALSVGHSYPGLQGVGFMRLLDPATVSQFEEEMRGLGFVDFKITPSGPPKRDYVTAVEIIEPFDWRNQRAFGYDASLEATRRNALELAWATGDMTITGKLTLLQETETDTQVGFVMLMACFSEAAKDGQSAPPPESLLGWAFAPFRMNDLIGVVVQERTRELSFELYDVTADSKTLLYRSRQDMPAHAEFKAVRTIKIGHRQWQLVVKSLPSFDTTSHLGQFILVAGLLESLVVFIITLGFVTKRNDALVQEGLFNDIESSEKRIAVILNSTTTALLVADADGNILEANRQASELFGYARQTLLSMKIEGLIPAELRERHSEYRRHYTAAPQKRPMGNGQELYAQDVRGEQIPVEIGLSPIKTDSGVQILATIVDIRERLKDKNEKDRIMAQLAAKNIEMEKFVYTVSHDLKSPLVTINGFTKLLTETLDSKVDEKQAHWLKRIAANAQSMEGLLNDLLNLSKILHRDLELEEVDIDKVCNQVVAGLGTQIKESGAQLFWDIQVPTVVAHARLLEQCLQNLIGNALQYRQSNCVCEILLASRIHGDWVEISVADNGIGIAPNHHERIFAIFERLSVKSSPGSGVGLAVVKTAMEKHGGYVTLQSEPGHGSKFVLHFPKV